MPWLSSQPRPSHSSPITIKFPENVKSFLLHSPWDPPTIHYTAKYVTSMLKPSKGVSPPKNPRFLRLKCLSLSSWHGELFVSLESVQRPLHLQP